MGNYDRDGRFLVSFWATRYQKTEQNSPYNIYYIAKSHLGSSLTDQCV